MWCLKKLILDEELENKRKANIDPLASLKDLITDCLMKQGHLMV